MNLPQLFLNRMEKLLGDEYIDFLKSYDVPSFTGLRVNSLKIQPQRLQDILGVDLIPIPWCREGFYYPSHFRPAKEIFYHCGLYYIQEPSAMCAASIFDVSPGHKVLDLCAAPGGKSTHLGAKLAGEGLLAANDISASRCKPLAKNIELMGITNAIVMSETPEKLASRFEGYFDRILIDAPCSGEGMFRKDSDSIKNWDEGKRSFYSKLQKEILLSAAKMLVPGGKILYSTCTFAPEENEGVIKEFLDGRDDFSLLPIDHEGFDKGRPEWAGCDDRLAGCGRLWPHKVAGEGHFAACLQKAEDTDFTPKEFLTEVIEKKNTKEIEYFMQFCDKFMNGTFMTRISKKQLVLHEQSLFMVPENLPSLKGIRVIRSGFHLGDMKLKRFEPSQALALGIRKDEAEYVIDFSSQSTQNEGIRYVKGESFEWDASDGWNLVCIDGFPLGWGKVQNGRIKNKYSKSWMMN